MKYIITETQYNSIKEYFDPVYFLKKKLSKEPKSIKDPQFVPYEGDFQKLVDVIFKLTTKVYGPIKHLKGLKVLKVTPDSTTWSVVVQPIVDDWFNWRENNEYVDQLRNFRGSFMETVRMGGFDSPHNEEGLPRNIIIFLALN